MSIGQKVLGSPMRDAFRNAWGRARAVLPGHGFVFGRPLLVLQSDDWGRVGVRDAEVCTELRAAGVNLGERPYDYYSLETAEDIHAISSLLNRHRDSTVRAACLGMNFILANIDFARVYACDFQQIHLRTLNDGLPDAWSRAGLFDAYRGGIAEGVLSPALHGATHFCGRSVERHLKDSGERGLLLRTLWKAGVPYIHWRMPWIGFEYADPLENGGEAFLNPEVQETLIADAVKTFNDFFSTPPRSACAPGYRANENTHGSWAKYGIRVAQNGPGLMRAPHLESHGTNNNGSNNLLHLYRSTDFEPATTHNFSIGECVEKAAECFSRGLPAIVSVHSINFHSAIKDFRSGTLRLLNQFLSVLEQKFPNLLYVRDEDIYDLVDKGTFESMNSVVRVEVKKKIIHRGLIARARPA